MNFSTPTTKAKMYQTLNELYHYYRINRIDYEGITLTPFTLTRMTANTLTDEEIEVKAEMLLEPVKEKRVLDYVEDLKNKCLEIDSLIAKVTLNSESDIASVNEAYLNAEKKLKTETQKAGMIESGLYAESVAKLLAKKQKEIERIQSVSDAETERLETLKADYEERIEDAEEHFSDLYNAEFAVKISELKAERDKELREVFKYNNDLDEKEVRYRNTMAQVSANLQLKYIQIKAQELSKEELLDLGYYDDVINCITGYYDSLSAVNAYSDIRHEPKLALYLDEYYQDIVYMYKQRAES